jgi:hypothetical protein
METKENYTISGADTPVASAAVRQSATVVRLTIPFTISGDYTVLVQNVVDLDGNVIDPLHDTASFTILTWYIAEAGGGGGLTNPYIRYTHAMAFDSSRNETVLFGGWSGPGGGDMQDTWTWNGTSWTPESPASKPAKRQLISMAYDSNRGVTVLFGGTTGGNETWEWNGSNWVQQFPASSPLSRFSHAMAYDSNREVTVLFGGYRAGTYYQDTWEWNGSTWAECASGAVTKPDVKRDHAMAYDSVRGVTVLFGGYNGGVLTNDTWEWDGANWVPKSPIAKPSIRKGHTMAYDSSRNVTVLFGGWIDAAVRNNETWEWDGTNWTRRFPINSPSARYWHGMTYDASRNACVVFGDVDDATYEYKK